MQGLLGVEVADPCDLVHLLVRGHHVREAVFSVQLPKASQLFRLVGVQVDDRGVVQAVEPDCVAVCVGDLAASVLRDLRLERHPVFEHGRPLEPLDLVQRGVVDDQIVRYRLVDEGVAVAQRLDRAERDCLTECYQESPLRSPWRVCRSTAAGRRSSLCRHMR